MMPTTGKSLSAVAVAGGVALTLALLGCGTPAGVDGVATATRAVSSSHTTSQADTRTPVRATSVVGAPPHRATVAPADLTQTIAADRATVSSNPPRSTLAYAAQRQEGRTSSFTWNECAGGRCRVVHADAPGITIPPVEERLVVPTGAELTFMFGGATTPTIVSVIAYVLDEESPRFPRPGAGWLQRWDQRTTSLPWRQAGQTVTIAADLSPAEYVIVIDLRSPVESAASENSVPYGFRVVVQ